MMESPLDSSASGDSPSPAPQSRSNPFSIDYILSSDEAAKQRQQPAATRLIERLSMFTKPPVQAGSMRPEHLSAPSQQSARAALDQQHRAGQQVVNPLAPSRLMEAAVHAGEQQTLAKQQQQQLAASQNPNFLYFMACMLVQQQQQRQHLQMQLQQQQQQNPNPIGYLEQLSASAASAALKDQARARLGAQLAQVHQRPSQFQLLQQQQQHCQRRAYSPLFSMHQTLQVTPGSPVAASAAKTRPMLLHQHQQGELGAPPPKQLKQPAGSKPACPAATKAQLEGARAAGPPQALQAQPAPPPPSAAKLESLKPAHSYIGLIGMCILSTPEKRMVLNDIYQYILDHYPYYRNRGSGWRNSVRHNLSLNECFQKAGRAANGKGHYWTIHPANMQDFMHGDFRRRRAQRKVRRWNNMDVPSDESDDESTEDANRPPLPEHFKRSLEMHARLQALGFGAPLASLRARGFGAEPPLELERQQQQQVCEAEPCDKAQLGAADFIRAAAAIAAAAAQQQHRHSRGEQLEAPAANL